MYQRKFKTCTGRNFKILGVSVSSKKNKRGDIMRDSYNTKFPVCERIQRMQDVLMVSSFALWAVVIGFAPVLTYRLLMS